MPHAPVAQTAWHSANAKALAMPNRITPGNADCTTGARNAGDQPCIPSPSAGARHPHTAHQKIVSRQMPTSAPDKPSAWFAVVWFCCSLWCMRCFGWYGFVLVLWIVLCDLAGVSVCAWYIVFVRLRLALFNVRFPDTLAGILGIGVGALCQPTVMNNDRPAEYEIP